MSDLLDDDHRVAHVDAVALGDGNLRDSAARLGEHVVFHLHRFEHQQHVTGSDLVAFLDVDVQDGALHLGGDGVALGADLGGTTVVAARPGAVGSGLVATAAAAARCSVYVYRGRAALLEFDLEALADDFDGELPFADFLVLSTGARLLGAPLLLGLVDALGVEFVVEIFRGVCPADELLVF